jgi:hypothetical protein
MMICCEHARLRYTLVLAVGLAAGCSGSGDDLPREPVWGTVTLDNQPLATGVIQFGPADKAAGAALNSAGGQITDGKFSISREQGLVPGKYNVAINAAEKTEKTKPEQPGARKRSELAKELIPAQYNSQTKLTAEVKKGGGNDFAFTLESAKK